MAGHNKWSKVKHIKAKTDAVKGKAFAKAAREITVCVKLGGTDPAMNPSLRLALQKARDVNMPKDNIQRAIDKGAGADGGENLDEITYEGYAPGGIALLIRTLTDNKNRTVPNVRAALTKAGGTLANQGAVQYLFDKKGVILFDDDCDADQVVGIGVESGADDVDVQPDGCVEVFCATDLFESVVGAFQTAGLNYVQAGIEMVPQTRTLVTVDQATALLKLLDALDTDDDVQDVFHNADIPEGVLDA